METSNLPAWENYVQGKATIAGHPLHPMLVAVPIGCFIGALTCDIILAFTHDPFWPAISVVLIGFGIVGALVAALFGFIDYFSAPVSAPAKSTATYHMIVNLVAVVVFVAAFFLRRADNLSTAGISLTVLGVVILGAGGWLGGHLSYHFGIGVDPRIAP
jgi:uncharacterized membrane protein